MDEEQGKAILGAGEFKRYIRQIILEDFGLEGQLKLKAARVLVIGAGGLGCPVLQYLNAAGVGMLGVVEHDIVEETNLHRQVIYTPADVGKPKIACMGMFLQNQNPHTKLMLHNLQLVAGNARELIKEYDYVVDGTDNFSTRYLVNDTCVELGKPLVYGSIQGYNAQLAVFNQELRGGKRSKNLRDVFAEAPDNRDAPSCTENGVLATVPGIAGMMMAQHCLALIRGEVPLPNELLLFNTQTMQAVNVSY